MGADVGAVIEVFGFLELTLQGRNFGDCLDPRQSVFTRCKIALWRLMLCEKWLVGQVEYDIKYCATFYVRARKINGLNIAAGRDANAVRLAKV